MSGILGCPSHHGHGWSEAGSVGQHVDVPHRIHHNFFLTRSTSAGRWKVNIKGPLHSPEFYVPDLVRQIIAMQNYIQSNF